MAKNRTCISCGEKYSYCPDCSRVAALEPVWRSEFCSESCMTLWTTLTKYNMDFLTKDEAKEIVSTLSLKPIDVYVNCVQRDYAKVMAEESKFKRGKRIEMKPIDDAMIEPVALELEHEVVIEKEKE